MEKEKDFSCTSYDVLAVDDDTVIRNIIQKTLQSAGYSVKCAENGKSALEFLKTQKFKLLIVDMVMPDVDGIQTIIKINKDHPGQKFIAISGGGRVKADYYLDLADTLGAACILEKPFTAEKLLERVKASLNSD